MLERSLRIYIIATIACALPATSNCDINPKVENGTIVELIVDTLYFPCAKHDKPMNLMRL